MYCHYFVGEDRKFHYKIYDTIRGKEEEEEEPNDVGTKLERHSELRYNKGSKWYVCECVGGLLGCLVAWLLGGP
jgi:hypothetical protein